MGAETSRYILNRISGMMQSHHIHEDRSHRIYFGQMSQDDTIPLHSRRPRSPNHFRASAEGWYNPTTFSRTEVTGSIVDRCPGMIQSLFILKDRGLQITLGKMPRDDMIPLQHHYSPFWGRSFRTTPSLSRKCSNSTRGRSFVSTSSSKPSSSTSSFSEYWKNHHLYL